MANDTAVSTKSKTGIWVGIAIGVVATAIIGFAAANLILKTNTSSTARPAVNPPGGIPVSVTSSWCNSTPGCQICGSRCCCDGAVSYPIGDTVRK